MTKPRRPLPVIELTLAIGMTLICIAVWLQVFAR